METKFKVGEKVRVKSLSCTGYKRNSILPASKLCSTCPFKHKIATIKTINYDGVVGKVYLKTDKGGSCSGFFLDDLEKFKIDWSEELKCFLKK